MNPVLEEIISTGNTRTISGGIKKVIGQISPEEGKLIQDCINKTGAEISVEVGLAFGTSALYICDALFKSDKTRHYVIDPYQMYEDSYSGIGLNNLKKAGYENIVDFIDKPSHQALAELERKNVKADFAFIDGWHTFDHALVDFFLIDKLLRIDGIVILDDSDWKAVRKVCSFISNNRAYKFIGGTSKRSYINENVHRSGLKKYFNRMKNFFKGYVDDEQKRFGAMAFQKVSGDDRRWDHFVDFS
ncbi:MAG: class I SAM-dependent methyltransferase [Ignavibacteria bacterium]|nr:class I SAM-dependent methyltransferase [Ignavibacteria bacterium]